MTAFVFYEIYAIFSACDSVDHSTAYMGLRQWSGARVHICRNFIGVQLDTEVSLCACASIDNDDQRLKFL
jgi:hypothetical protein